MMHRAISTCLLGIKLCLPVSVEGWVDADIALGIFLSCTRISPTALSMGLPLLR